MSLNRTRLKLHLVRLTSKVELYCCTILRSRKHFQDKPNHSAISDEEKSSHILGRLSILNELFSRRRVTMDYNSGGDLMKINNCRDQLL